MNKLLTLSAFAVAAMAAGQVYAADAKGSVYGDFRYSAVYNDTQDDGQGSEQALNNNASRIGVDASISENGLTGFVKYERLLENDGEGNTVRQAYVGVKGNFGTVTAGTQSLQYRKPTLALDALYDTSLVGTNANGILATNDGASYGFSALNNNDFRNSTLQYSSPEIAPGLTFNAGVEVDEVLNDRNHGYEAGAKYTMQGLTAGAQVYFKDNDQTAIRAYGSYDLKPVVLTASLENINPDAAGVDSQNFLNIGAAMPLDSKSRVAGSIGLHDDGNDTGFGVNAAYFRNIMSNTEMYAGVRYADPNTTNSEGTFTVATGVTYKFALNR